jgi:hypothetical protein
MAGQTRPECFREVVLDFLFLLHQGKRKGNKINYPIQQKVSVALALTNARSPACFQEVALGFPILS